MKKWIKRIAFVSLMLFMATVVITYFSLNSLLRSVIQTQASSSLKVTTTLEAVELAMLGGHLNLIDLEIASPPKFDAPHIFTLGEITVDVNYGDLTKQPIHISRIQINNPVLVIEQSNMKLNIQALMDQSSESAAPAQSPSAAAQPAKPSEPMKLVIDELDLNNAQVNFQPGLPGLSSSYQVLIPSLTLKNIGNADGTENGAAIKEVVMQVLTALTAKATSSGKLPIDLNKFVNDNLSNVSASLGTEFNKQLATMNESVAKNASPAISNVINNATTQGGQQLQNELNGLLKKK